MVFGDYVLMILRHITLYYEITFAALAPSDEHKAVSTKGSRANTLLPTIVHKIAKVNLLVYILSKRIPFWTIYIKLFESPIYTLLRSHIQLLSRQLL